MTPHRSDSMGDQMRASFTLPTELRSTRYRAPGLRAAREAAGMTVEQVADLCAIREEGAV